jgi:hypothetical protein
MQVGGQSYRGHVVEAIEESGEACTKWRSVPVMGGDNLLSYNVMTTLHFSYKARLTIDRRLFALFKGLIWSES